MIDNLKVAVISSQQVVKKEGGFHTTNVTFFNLLKKTTIVFDEILVICREDRIDKRKKSFIVEAEKIIVNTYKAGINNSYISIAAESPIIFLKLLYFIHKNKKTIDIVWIPDIRIVGFLAVFASIIFRIPFFLYIRGNNYREAIDRSINKPFIVKAIYLFGIKLEYFLATLILRNAPTVVCGSALMRDYRSRYHPTYKFMSSIIDEDDIEKEQKSILGKDIIKLLFVGRIVKYKGLKYAIEALAILIDSIKDTSKKIQLIIVGDGDERENVEKLITEHNLSNHVLFKGFVDDKMILGDIYKECDILIVPSLTEGTPKIVPEAMAKGLPIIASNVGELPVMVKHTKTGYIVNPADSKAIASSILLLLTHPNLYGSMSKNSLIRSKEFTFDKQFNRIMDVINQLV